MRNADDVRFADRALLEVNEPLLETVDVEHVFAHWDLHQGLLLLEVLQTEPALLLLSHVAVLVTLFGLLRSHSAILDAVHDFEVDADDCLCLLIHVLFLVELSIVVGAGTLSAAARAFFALSEEKADHLDQDDQQEKENGPRDQNHDDTVRQVLVFQLKRLCFRLRVARDLGRTLVRISQLKEP